MRNKAALEELRARILLLVEKYNRIKEENMRLTEELSATKKKIEEQNIQILKLQEEEELKLMQLEDMTQKITKMLT